MATTLAIVLERLVIASAGSDVAVLASDRAHELKERLLDVNEGLRASLEKSGSQLLGHLATFFRRHLSLVRQIELVAEENDRDLVDLIDVSHALQLVQERGEFLVEGSTASNGINDEETFTISDPLLSHRRILENKLM